LESYDTTEVADTCEYYSILCTTFISDGWKQTVPSYFKLLRL